MHNLRRFYYQNKEKIWKVVLIIAFLLGLIYYMNDLVEKQSKPSNVVAMPEKDIYSDTQNKTYISDKSPVTGGTVTKQEVEIINNTISKFLEYCKNEKYEQAYNMLSVECKENEYVTLEKFKNEYIKSRFKKESVYEIEKWIRNTYKISISEDILATGNVNNNKKQIEYITIVEENSEEKLNINSYIGKTNINKSATQNNVKITALEKRSYMDYEIYDFQIENLSNKTIKVDSLEKTNTMYIKDSDGNTYNSYSHEILEDELELKSNRSINISIKYANVYSSKTSIRQIAFENVILDYIEYKKADNKKEFKEITEIEINLY